MKIKIPLISEVLSMSDTLKFIKALMSDVDGKK